MSIYDDWKAKNTGTDAEKQVANVEFCLKAIDTGVPATNVLRPTGTNDHTRINAAITALPSTGGKIILREGTYNLGGSINVNKSNVTIQGMGASTILNATATVTNLINITGTHCKILDLNLTNNSTVNITNAITVSGSGNNCTIAGNICATTNASGGSSRGIQLNSNCNNNYITENKCSNGVTATTVGDFGSYGISADSSNNIITGNECSNTLVSGNWGSTGIMLGQSGGNNTVTGNQLINSNNSSSGSNGIFINSANSKNVIIGNICSCTAYAELALFKASL